MTRDRLTSQIQADQTDLFRLQNQLSTGFRIFLPSDDAASAQRAIALQRTIERKEQSATNASGAQVALATADSALNSVSSQLNSLKAEALAVVDTIASENERNATIETIDRLIDELTRVGNTTFTSTYVFGGSETSSPPYDEASLYVEFFGTEDSPQTYVDIGQLFDAGVSGADIFGGFSEPAGDGADLNPQLTPTTRLSQLNGGLGVSPDGAIEILFQPTAPGDPAVSATIDLSRASTVGDVARLIEAGAPEGADLAVTVSGAGLRVDVANGGVTINEVGQGVAARELGLLTTGVPQTTILGDDVGPVILRTDRVDDLLGAKARGRIDLGGVNNDLVLTANTNGSALNGLTVEIIDVGPGAATAAYDGGTNTLTVRIEDGVTTATEIVDAINDTAGIPVTAETDYRDQTTVAAQGTGQVSAGYSDTPLSGGADGEVDVASGLLITNGLETYTVDTSSAETVEDLLSLLNTPEYGLDAQINAAGDGIDVRTRRSGADFTIGENGGTTATDLGIRTYTGSTRLSDFNRGVGVFEEVDTQGLTEAEAQAQRLAQNEFVITVVEDGVTQSYTINPVGLTSVDDLLLQINADTAGAVDATLATVGNGIALTVTDPDTPATAASGSFALGAATLTIDANLTGPAGNRPFTVEVVDSGGAGPLTTTVVGDTVTVDLLGVPANTADIAQSIEDQLPGFTVSADLGAEVISAAVGPINAATLGGAIASELADPASGSFALAGDTIRFDADVAGADGNRPFAVSVVDSGGTGPLTTTVDGDTITVDLQGLATTTADIAQSISDQLAGFTVSSDGTAAVAPLDVPTFPASFDATTSGGQDADSITVSGAYAERLGLIPPGQDSVSSTTGGLTSEDRHTLEVDSVFTTLVRMREALVAESPEALGREINRFDDDLDRLNFGRAEVGVRLRNLEDIQIRLADEQVELQSALSNEIDADLVEVISDYTAKQFSYQAALQTAGSLLNLSLLDFI